jgi:hypothetical protein
MVSRSERDRRSDVSFEDEQWLNFFPQRHPELRPSNFEPNKGVRGKHEFVMSPFEHDLLVAADGGKPINEILKRKAFAKMAIEQRRSLSKEFYKRMWRGGHMFFSLVPVRRNASGGA